MVVRRLISLWFVMLVVLSVPNGLAQSNSATATTTVSISIPAQVLVTQIEPFVLGNWSGAGPMSGEQAVCVWSSTGGYNITATTTEGGSRFSMLGANNRMLDYSVHWNSGAGYQELVSGQSLAGQSTSSRSADCSNGTEASERPFLKVLVAEADLDAAKAGAYSDVLEILIAVE